jgi:DHA1 family bicyclomycin/chloramphenicol resistance-like MFS transporter
MKQLRARCLLITLIVICILGGMEVDLFVPSIPEIQESFHLSAFSVQLLISINFIAYSVSLLFAGTLGDRFNRRYIMLSGTLIFVLGSVLCVLSPNLTGLLLGRFFQGIGIAAPSALCFPEIVDHYPIEKQAALIGIINGFTTIAMAFAPVIGSYMVLFWHWRFCFVVLLVIGIISLLMSWLFLPHRKGNPKVELSPKAYAVIIKSPVAFVFTLALSVLVVPYWLFIAMSPILYMEDLNVPLHLFGFYQGALAAAFSILSFLSPTILSALGQRRCLKYGMVLCAMTTFLMLVITLTRLHHPFWITAVMMFAILAVLFPINILLPLAIEVIPNAKSRMSAYIMSLRLFITAIAIQIVSYVYNDTLFYISFAMFLTFLVFMGLMVLLYRKKWIVLTA